MPLRLLTPTGRVPGLKDHHDPQPGVVNLEDVNGHAVVLRLLEERKRVIAAEAAALGLVGSEPPDLQVKERPDLIDVAARRRRPDPTNHFDVTRGHGPESPTPQVARRGFDRGELAAPSRTPDTYPTVRRMNVAGRSLVLPEAHR